VRFAKFLTLPLIQLHRATDGVIKVRMLTPLGRWRTTRFQAEDLVEVGPSVPYGKRQGSRFVSPGRGTDKVGKLLGIWELPLRTRPKASTCWGLVPSSRPSRSTHCVGKSSLPDPPTRAAGWSGRSVNVASAYSEGAHT
jgi:hypothetical protein